MTQLRSPIEDALRAAIDDCLMSMVYAALNSGLDHFDDRKKQLKEWRTLGSYVLAQNLVLSSSPGWESYPDTFPVDAWIAEHLRTYDAGMLTYVVGLWLDKRPLPAHVSDDPFEEELKVRRLKRLLLALNP